MLVCKNITEISRAFKELGAKKWDQRPNIYLLCVPPKTGHKALRRCLCACVNSSIVHSSPKVEAAHACTEAEWTSKMHAGEYYVALQKKEILTYAAMSMMKREDVIPSEISQPQKEKYNVISPYKRHLM